MISETDMVDVVLLSIAGTCARHGLLRVLPYPIQHKAESFGSVARKDRPLSETTRFFLAALYRREGPAAG